MPESRMSPDSSSRLSFKVTSSSSSFWTAAYTLSSSPFSFGARAKVMSWGASCGMATAKGALSSLSVSPVRVFFSLPTAMIAPGPSTSLQGVCVLPSR